MPSGNSSVQRELDKKLRQAHVLIADAIRLAAQLSVPSRRSSNLAPTPTSSGTFSSVRFDMNERAFVKRYAKQAGGGPKKFVLLMAFVTKGEVGKEVELGEIEKMWNKMSSRALLGMKFNRFFSNAAKDQGWVNSPKRGFYSLDRTWKEALSNG